MKNISEVLADHYVKKFAEHGPTPEGVDWGANPADHILRLNRMLSVLDMGFDVGPRKSLLDVGCGYGSLNELVVSRGLSLDYIGIDMCSQMIEVAKEKYPSSKWLVGDILAIEGKRRFDYIICNGVLTQKLDVSIRDMDQFLLNLVTRMYELCRIGVAFNVMTTHVNFMASNLYYRNPAELLGWCMTALTPRVRLDHAYPLYEYTIYLYREDAAGLVYGAHREEIP